MAEESSQKSTQFSDAFPAARVIELANGTSATFAKLDLDDLTSWCDAMHEEWKKRAAKLFTPNMKPVEQFQAKRLMEFSRPSLDDIQDATFRPEGIKEALTRSLVKGGTPKEKVGEIVKQVSPRVARKLAQDMVSLFDVQVPKTPTNLPEDSATDGEPAPATDNHEELPSGQQLTGSVPPLVRSASEENIGG